MELLMDFAQATAAHVSINFGGADAGVAEQFLDNAQIGPMLEQMGRETMAQHVRGHVPADPGGAHAPLDSPPKCNAGECRASLREEDIRGRALLAQDRKS